MSDEVGYSIRSMHSGVGYWLGQQLPGRQRPGTVPLSLTQERHQTHSGDELFSFALPNLLMVLRMDTIPQLAFGRDE